MQIIISHTIQYVLLIKKYLKYIFFTVSPVSLKPIGEKLFPGERLRWASMADGVLPPDAMVGGFESEPTYIARAEHNNSICPGKYVPSRRRAFVPWGHMEHPKENFQV